MRNNIPNIITNGKHYFENAPDTKNEIIFLGNSITEGGDWKALFLDKNLITREISGDVTDGILFRLDEVTASKPLKIFLLIGTNDMARGKSIDFVLKTLKKLFYKSKGNPRTQKYTYKVSYL